MVSCLDDRLLDFPDLAPLVAGPEGLALGVGTLRRATKLRPYLHVFAIGTDGRTGTAGKKHPVLGGSPCYLRIPDGNRPDCHTRSRFPMGGRRPRYHRFLSRARGRLSPTLGLDNFIRRRYAINAAFLCGNYVLDSTNRFFNTKHTKRQNSRKFFMIEVHFSCILC